MPAHLRFPVNFKPDAADVHAYSCAYVYRARPQQRSRGSDAAATAPRRDSPPPRLTTLREVVSRCGLSVTANDLDGCRRGAAALRRLSRKVRITVQHAY
mmetsp:Transcript_15777/g.50293  ORF Transcript_15777/g.50293 Transcript_15777/m.50293 type:complete len:99 (+) Transcript_15777:152-448(+)